MAEYFEMQNEDTSIISYDISVIPNDFNVMTINSLIESGIISMPAFQRNYVWDRKRASRFIESLILVHWKRNPTTCRLYLGGTFLSVKRLDYRQR